MEHKRILTLQDISCVGQCSLTVALPVISACGVEAAVLPSAVLSTHTAPGFSGFTCRDLTEDMPAIAAHWQAKGITFDAFYTGYLGSAEQIDHALAIKRSCCAEGLLIADPAMADGGALYVGFDAAFVQEMKRLCAAADYILPNLTEACLLTDTPYPAEGYDADFITALLEKLGALGCKNIILKGISYREGSMGIEVWQQGARSYYEHEKLDRSRHGTGDIYASAFVGALMRGKDAYQAAAIAADYAVACIRATEDEHWYGTRFESVLGELIAALNS